MDSDGNNKKQLTTTEGFNIRPTFSSNGKEIVFLSNRDNHTEVYTMNSDGTNQKRLTNNNFTKEYPHFSPDGLNIIYHQKTEEGTTDIFLIKIGSGEIINLTKGAGNNYKPLFGPVL
ncbi:MAG: PD40 domain-containing protein [Bacteroidetes bacterium]|nr:PD40 domain-containing protein [Bacteroidota bacterium]